MSDTKEYYEALDEYNKERRKNNFEKNLKILTEANVPMRVRSDGVYEIGIAFKQTFPLFYPSSGKWQHKGRTYIGGALSFLGWLKNKAGFDYKKIKK